jgi:uncharacterized protein
MHFIELDGARTAAAEALARRGTCPLRGVARGHACRHGRQPPRRQTLAVIILSLSLFLIVGCEKMQTGRVIADAYPKVCFEDSCYQVELALDEISQAEGLMYRDELLDGHGMLFVFDSTDKHSFWMKNTKMPLDIIWLDKNKQVVYIKENAEPCRASCPSIKPDKSAKYVLEINGGEAATQGIAVGSVATYKNIMVE